MASIAVLGNGAMGSRMAMRLLAAGHEVIVWNRSPDALTALVEAGAKVAETPRNAAQSAAFVIVMVRDDAASRAVWLDPETGALAGMGPEAVAIESSTLSAAWIGLLAAAMMQRTVPFLDAPVAGSRPQAEAGQLIYFVGGEAETVTRAEPILTAMAAAVHHVGSVGAGTSVKLAINTLFGVQVAALAEIFAILRRSGFDAQRAMEVLGTTPVCSPAAKGAIGSMLSQNYAPLFPVELVEKDFGYALASAEAVGLPAPLTAATRKLFSEAIDRGFGGEHLTSVARLYL